MPLYEYRCNICGTEFEKIMRWSEAEQAPTCPTCLSQDTQKKISTTASLSGSAAEGGSTSMGSSCGSSGRFS